MSVLAGCATLAAGGILASNMAFKINYPLVASGVGGSKSGTNTLALPYVRRSGVVTAFDLIKSIEGGGPPFSKVISVSKYLAFSDSLCTYTGRHTPCAVFNLVAGEGYRVQMSQPVNYTIVGAHDPSVVVSLAGPGVGSKSGTNDFAPPYNITTPTAFDLIRDIEGVTAPPFSKVVSISRFMTATDGLQTYTGRMGTPSGNFPLTPGESYRIQMSVTVPYVSSHY